MNFSLKKGALRAEVTDQGAELIGFWDGAGTQYIWEGDPAFWSGRNPQLFPTVGNLAPEGVLIHGQRYQMKRHGFARNKVFRLVEQCDDAITLELTEDADSLSRYPFPFRLRIVHQLLENGFSTTFQVKNTGDAPMPYCVGAHTGFRCPLHPGEVWEDYQLVFDQVEDAPSPSLTEKGLSFTHTVDLVRGTKVLPLDRDRFAALDTLIFREPRSTGVSLLHKVTGRGLRVDFPGFPMVAFWTAGLGSMVCIEPWHGCAATDSESGEFTDKPYCVILQPGKEKALTYTVGLV